MEVLDIKSFLNMKESETADIITDQLEIERILKNIADSHIALPMFDDIEKTVDIDNLEIKQILEKLRKCVLYPEISLKTAEYLDIILSYYIKEHDDFYNFCYDMIQQEIECYENYNQMKSAVSAPSKCYDETVENFWYDKNGCLFMKNVSISYLGDENALYVYLYNETEPIYNTEWNNIGGEKTIHQNKHTVLAMREMFDDCLKNQFSQEDWKNETERIFGSEENYRKYKGF